MSSAECLRHLINERLTAAAEEIFRGFQTTIIKYEEEIDRQSRLLELLKPEVKLQRTELQHQHVSEEEEEEEEFLAEGRNSSLDQDEPELTLIKEEQEEICTNLIQDEPEPLQFKEENEEFYRSLEVEQLVLKQETETFMTPTCEQIDSAEDQTLIMTPDETQSAADDLYHKCHTAESQDHNGGKHEGSTRNAEPLKQESLHECKNHTKNEGNSSTLKIQNASYTGIECFKCDTCGKSFKYKSHFLTHIRVHTGEKPYNCKTCRKEFSLMENLKKHMRIHTDEKPYQCTACEKSFSLLGTLRVHMRTHTGERPYLCNICEKRFSHLDTLKKHVRRHTGERPYLCNACEKRFSELSALKVHMRIHTGEKPYNCEICGRGFRQRHQLKAHMRTHLGESRYHCKTCGTEFRRRYQLKDHMKTHVENEDSVGWQI